VADHGDERLVWLCKIALSGISVSLWLPSLIPCRTTETSVSLWLYEITGRTTKPEATGTIQPRSQVAQTT
jgi:hypothetical protein